MSDSQKSKTKKSKFDFRKIQSYPGFDFLHSVVLDVRFTIKNGISIWFSTGKYMLQIEYFLIFFILTTAVYLVFLTYVALLISQTRVIHIPDSYQVKLYPNVADIQIPIVNSDAYIVYEPESRVIVAGKNTNFRFSPASTAKIMTALIALENYPLQKVFTASNMDIAEVVEGSKMGLVDTEKMSVQNLLYGLLLPSGNDAAVTLAENFPGGMPAFVQRMGQEAKTLALSNTYFNDPAGFNDDNYTTAFDLARLTAIALKNPVFAKIVSTKVRTVVSADGMHVHPLVNLNELLSQPDVTGVKTGFTNEAAGVLVTSAVRQNHTYIIVVMKSQDRFADSYQLLNNVVRKTELANY